ncbi:hypothetical protein [Phaeocystidibacter marisrubri]|uniref:DUF4252 domain-containing protein n=1 Tax=Phaeocystidibacter marisrubri TaxID=1577780 RepID=A0A6L3ZGI1_9FLAO|nr:hypothetical protein [Phaeocystidibacter marisrubri]KAB2816562.1 hypothetical protein F8C82_12845 [Phaeocystidibacter marisrubri]
MMNKMYSTVWVMLLSIPMFSQSYSQLEGRFNRAEPTELDSSAYVNLGIQRAESLFELTNLYEQNNRRNSNYSMQSRISERIQKSFKDPELNDSAVAVMVTKIRRAAPAGEAVHFEHVEEAGTLGYVRAIDAAVPLEFNLILKKVVKNFGEESEEVWDVFLSERKKAK